MATPGFSGFGGGPRWVFSHFQVSSILLEPDALVLGGPTTHQCVCLFVRLSGYLSLFLFYFSNLFLFSEFLFSLISKSAALLSRDQMRLSWVVPLRLICLNLFACLSACHGSFSIPFLFLTPFSIFVIWVFQVNSPLPKPDSLVLGGKLHLNVSVCLSEYLSLSFSQLFYRYLLQHINQIELFRGSL